MKLGTGGLTILRQFEGLSLVAYQCPAGIWTIGYGHTRDVHPGDAITRDRAEELLLEDLAWAEECVTGAVTHPLTQNQFDALVVFTFNVGPAAFRKSTLLKKINSGDLAGAYLEFARWNKAGGQPLPGLTARRAAEANLFKL